MVLVLRMDNRKFLSTVPKHRLLVFDGGRRKRARERVKCKFGANIKIICEIKSCAFRGEALADVAVRRKRGAHT
jgi:hypothetical protein